MHPLIQKLFWALGAGFTIASCVTRQTWHSNLESYKVAIVPFQSLSDSSHRGIIDRHVQCPQSPKHLESATPSGSSQLHCSINEKVKVVDLYSASIQSVSKAMNFGSRN